MNYNIDIDKIKVAIFDFDGTLAIHQDKNYLNRRKESEEKRLGYYLNAYKNPDTFYDDIEPCLRSEPLYELINILRKNNVKMYCLSGMKFSFHLKAKQTFINKYYGRDIEAVTAASQELKVDGVKIIKDYNKCNLDEILFVDDIEENIINLNNIGVKALLIEDVEKIVKKKLHV